MQIPTLDTQFPMYWDTNELGSLPVYTVTIASVYVFNFSTSYAVIYSRWKSCACITKDLMMCVRPSMSVSSASGVPYTTWSPKILAI